MGGGLRARGARRVHAAAEGADRRSRGKCSDGQTQQGQGQRPAPPVSSCEISPGRVRGGPLPPPPWPWQRRGPAAPGAPLAAPACGVDSGSRSRSRRCQRAAPGVRCRLGNDACCAVRHWWQRIMIGGVSLTARARRVRSAPSASARTRSAALATLSASSPAAAARAAAAAAASAGTESTPAAAMSNAMQRTLSRLRLELAEGRKARRRKHRRTIAQRRETLSDRRSRGSACRKRGGHEERVVWAPSSYLGAEGRRRGRRRWRGGARRCSRRAEGGAGRRPRPGRTRSPAPRRRGPRNQLLSVIGQRCLLCATQHGAGASRCSWRRGRIDSVGGGGFLCCEGGWWRNACKPELVFLVTTTMLMVPRRPR